jgi:hypothetical protein
VSRQVKVEGAKSLMKTEDASFIKTEEPQALKIPEAQGLMKECFQETNQSFEERQRKMKAEEEGKRQRSHSFHQTLLQMQRERAGTDTGLADQGTGLKRIQGTRLEGMEGMGTGSGSARTAHQVIRGGGGGGGGSGRSGPGTDAGEANGAAFNGAALSLSSFVGTGEEEHKEKGVGGVADRSRVTPSLGPITPSLGRVTPSLGHELGGAPGDRSREMAAREGGGRIVGGGGGGADSAGAGVVEVMREMMVKVAMEAEHDRAQREREREMEREARAALELKVLMLDKLVVEVAQERAERKMQQEQEHARRQRERAEMAELEAKLQQALHALTVAGYGTHSKKCPLDGLGMQSMDFFGVFILDGSREQEAQVLQSQTHPLYRVQPITRKGSDG